MPRRPSLTLGLALSAALLGIACDGELAQEKAREAAERARQSIQPIDAGALGQSVDADVVRRAQERLTALKEYMGPITGKLDPVTLNALEAFQRSQGITPDGRFNERTLTALEQAVRSQG